MNGSRRTRELHHVILKQGIVRVRHESVLDLRIGRGHREKRGRVGQTGKEKKELVSLWHDRSTGARLAGDS